MRDKIKIVYKIYTYTFGDLCEDSLKWKTQRVINVSDKETKNLDTFI